jgi:ligand-binding sensor domain-containing protein
MSKVLLLAILSALVLPCIAIAQEYSYSHYGITDGLAGSTVYCITQDKEGFIWTGTETGVSRFDGTHFKNFTTKDGLPDLEVLQIFGDSKGRVWMAPFRKSVCYYYQGKIHNQQNDAQLSRIHLQGNIECFIEDAEGNILLKQRNGLHILSTDGSPVEIDSLDHEPVSQCRVISRSASGYFLAQTNKKNIEFSRTKCLQSRPFPLPVSVNTRDPNDKAMNPHGVFFRDSVLGYKIWSFSNNKKVQIPIDVSRYKHISFSILDDSLVYINESTGSFEYNINTGQTRRYLPGIPVSRVFRDQAGDLWFTTLGEGIFRLNSSVWKTIRLHVEPGETSMVAAITKIGDELWIGDNHNYIFRYSLPDLALKYRRPFFYYMAPGRIIDIDTVGSNKVLAAGDYGLVKGTRDFRCIDILQVAVKSLVRINNREVLLATKPGAFIFDIIDFKIKDTLWHERATVVFNQNDTFYIGTLNGLYMSVKGQPLVYLGKETPFLRKRISSITESEDGTLWIASYDDAGIIGYKNNRQVIAFTRQQGLSSDICRTLLVHNNILWVGTDKGLNKIDLNKPGFPITQYTLRDGLASDMVNTIFADNSRIYVGTSAGLSFFDEKNNVPSEACRIYLLSLVNSERERITDTADLVIPYTNKRVRIEFAGISYRSVGKIIYRYRMAGIDSIWRETKETYLEYPDLPSGSYELQLMAINKFGNQSRILKVPITVTTQFWKKPWFVISVWVLSLALLWWLGAWRITRVRRKQHEKEMLMQKMSELENTALTSQMNPHFIFNCLNSIQQYIFSGDLTASNKYIAGLGKLIRMTLNNSTRSFVTLADEADYLSSYLSLEKMRFKDKIDYELVMEDTIDPTDVLLPPMLVQPFVENALQHGLQHKSGEKGFVSIKVIRDKEKLKITVEDNGIGRRAATGRRSAGLKEYLKEYSSKGMTLTEDRIDIMNKLYRGATTIEIFDKRDETNSPTGTCVVITLPYFQEQNLYS